MELTSIPVYRTWHLNERHYGSLQGRYRNEVIAEYGKKQVFRWRRVYDVRPPALEDGDPRLPASDPLYAGLDPARLPRTESHKDTVARVIPYWREAIAPQIRDGKRVLVASHTSSIRGLVKYIEQLSDEQIATFKIEIARPLVYKLDGELRPVDRFYLNTGWPSRVRLLASRLKPNSAMPAFDGRLRRNR